MTRLIAASIAQPIEALASFADFAARMETLLTEARGRGADLSVLPEYGSMGLASLFGAAVAADAKASVVAMQGLAADYDALFARLAARLEMHVLAPSFPLAGAGGRFFNVARLHTPQGRSGAQYKQVMTRFERETWDIRRGAEAGEGIKVFETALGRIGVAICYDAEFPLIARAMAEAGAEIILVPSCTDSHRGYWRVRIGAQARALENQCYVLHAPTVGDAPWSAAVDANKGAAAIYAPPDGDFPDDGVVAIGPLDDAAVVAAVLDLEKVRAVRREGKVLNHLHWAEQAGAPALNATLIDLR